LALHRLRNSSTRQFPRERRVNRVSDQSPRSHRDRARLAFVDALLRSTRQIGLGPPSRRSPQPSDLMRPPSIARFHVRSLDSARSLPRNASVRWKGSVQHRPGCHPALEALRATREPWNVEISPRFGRSLRERIERTAPAVPGVESDLVRGPSRAAPTQFSRPNRTPLRVDFDSFGGTIWTFLRPSAYLQLSNATRRLGRS